MEASYPDNRAGSVEDTSYSLVLFITLTEISLDSSELSRLSGVIAVTGLGRLPYKQPLRRWAKINKKWQVNFHEYAALNIINLLATPLLYRDIVESRISKTENKCNYEEEFELCLQLQKSVTIKA